MVIPMVKYINTLFNGSNGSSGLPPTMTLASDGSPVLVGEATVWNDQVTNSIVGHNTIQYSLVKTTFTHEIPYGNVDGKIWVKVNIPKGKSITLTFIVDNTKHPNNDAVFEFYDDFNGDNLDLNKWSVEEGYMPSIENGRLKINRETVIVANMPIMEKYIWEGKINIKQLNHPGFLYNHYKPGYYYDLYFEDGAIWKHMGSLWIRRRIADAIMPITTNKDYHFKHVITGNKAYLSVGNNHYTLTMDSTYDKGKIGFLQYHNYGLMYVDYVFVRKYIKQKPSIQINHISSYQYQVIVTNDTGSDIVETQIPIDLPTDKTYKVLVSSETPPLVCDAFPFDKNSYITFYTQFSHSVKINSKCEFHLHTYIPPDAPNGDIKLSFEWISIPVNYIHTDNRYIPDSVSNSMSSKITKTFTITDEMKGRHIVFSFGKLDTVRSVSQVMFCKLERLAMDPEDTFEYSLPILYVDWHTEMDTIGSQDMYKK